MEEKKIHRAHVLIVSYPSQGHINPTFQFAKRLASKGLKITLAITNFIYKTQKPPQPSDSVQIDTISDGYDDGGFSEAESIDAYLQNMEVAGLKTLAELITKYKSSSNPIDCVVYDAFLYWALDVAKGFGLFSAAFFTQTCAVNFIYYLVHHGLLKLPVSSTPVSIPGIPLLELQDMPSFIGVQGQYPAYFEMVLNQFSNADRADLVLVNTFYKLESQVADSMSKFCPMVTIGPTLPSFYLDNRILNDNDYDLNLFTLDKSITMNWLNTKPEGSVVYVSFGSMACLANKQVEELAWGLKKSSFYFLWVIRDTEETNKLPKGFVDGIGDKGLIVNWSPQLEVLSNKALGCFFSHAGWNSTIEALSLAVPMVVMPQWTDQPTDAKFVEDVWKVGVRVRVDEDGIVRRDEIERCIREVMEGQSGREMRMNAKKWSDLAIEAVSEAQPKRRCSLFPSPTWTFTGSRFFLSNAYSSTKLSREDIKKLRDKVNEIVTASDVKKSRQLHLSSFVLTLAYVFVCMFKAKTGEAQGNRNALVGFTADYRTRLDPPVPDNYFGNCNGIHGAVTEASEVKQENGVAFAAEMISDLIKGIDANVADEGSDVKIAKIVEHAKQGAFMLSVAGSTRFDVYGSDFGWGRPRKVEIVSIDRTGAVSFAESKDGGGGVEVGVVLEEQEMEVFASLFTNGLKK
ncbi:UDP-glycosyltransferase 74F2 [Citrus sinensis]|uniref:UDP-glycosyltransferase 74F2 n=1 Tax=Citrus sinensis TaxID=2711 RepID=A0ACB8M9Z3_CITSI|nr:UDP-glycosyltransferase 74F2 [Citrus sinensis]